MRIILCFALGLGVSVAALSALAQGTQSTQETYQTAETLRKSASSDAELRRSLEIHQKLFEQGEKKSLLRIAQVQMELGEHAKAATAFEIAANSGSGFARFLLAKNHATGAFDTFSNRDLGLGMLQDMAQSETPDRAQMALADLYASGNGGTPEQAFELYKTLGENGSARALWKTGQYLLDGKTVDTNPMASANAFQAAAEGGFDYALIGLSRAQITLGDFEGAKQSLDQAVDKGVKNAEAERAMAHFQGKLGTWSDKALGRSGVIALAQSGDTSAASVVLRNHERRSTRMNDANVSQIVQALEGKMQSGDRKATSVLARAYLKLRPFIRNARAKHATLVEEHLVNLPKTQRMAERVSAEYDFANHARSARKMTEILKSSSGEAYTKAALRLRGIEKTSYVYLLQSEMRDLGAYSGSISGKMTRSTINAIFAYCKAQNIFDTCKHGPVTYESSLLISKAIGEEKRIRMLEASKN